MSTDTTSGAWLALAAVTNFVQWSFRATRIGSISMFGFCASNLANISFQTGSYCASVRVAVWYWSVMVPLRAAGAAPKATRAPPTPATAAMPWSTLRRGTPTPDAPTILGSVMAFLLVPRSPAAALPPERLRGSRHGLRAERPIAEHVQVEVRAEAGPARHLE